ncbi:right-handed parallel beta-helix repeat-containing protein [Agromyces subbeticus]|uniref:right-handed parallel beta-helix repeat-containing protein n=1 Tax=Agromyces subbeticus TaxID=293890 RepID=UPI0003B76E58|nr:right-handed parallel beta-helix repeat-containing protein [Agromyces subbeticus]
MSDQLTPLSGAAPRPRRLLRAVAGAGIAAIALSTLAALPAHAAEAVTVFVATNGDDANPGTSAGAPVASMTRAQELVREALPSGAPVTVQLAEGEYYLDSTLALTNADSGTESAPVRWVGAGEGATINGGRKLTGTWTPSAADPTVMVTDVPDGIDFDELFVDDSRQVMARYPNWDDSASRLEGTTSMSTLNSRSAGWSKPTSGYVRAMHCHDWGSVSFTISGRAENALQLAFVGDNNRPQDCNATLPMKADAVMVENIREELDATNEWFLDRDANKLYLKPAQGVDLSAATIEVGELDQLVTLNGTSPEDPIHDISFENLGFERTHRTLFNSPFISLSRGDWSVVAKGAAYLKNSRDVTFTNSSFADLGGNGIYLEGYNSGTAITASRFENNGATDVHVVGSPAAVRNYAGNYFTTPPISDLGSGPKTEDYPRDILIEGNVMRNNGRYEKQTSSVNIAMALDVTVRGNSLSDSPRACLNFSDNTWGGHLIQDNDIFDCVRETGDNGSINSWGRSRFWKTGASNNAFASLAEGVTFMGNTGGALNAEQARAMMKLDVIEPITIDHNRFWHDGDWAIDLDDGSSNFVMTNNVLLKGGVKLRDGFERTLRNNLILNGATFEQVSYMPGGDVIEQNITLGRLPYDNVLNDPGLAQYSIGKNLFWNAGAAIDVKPRGGATEKLSVDGTMLNTATSWYAAGMDRDSAVGDPVFSDADPTGNYDFTVAGTSPALALGYQNIPMTGFGAADGALPPEAVLPTGTNGPDPIDLARRKYVEHLWGGEIANITTAAEQSSYAISDFKGVKFVSAPDGSLAATAGLRTDDLVRTINGIEVGEQRNSFWQAYNALPGGAAITLDVRRASTNVTVELTKPTDAEKINNTSGVIYRSAQAPTQESWIWRDAGRGGGGAWLDDIDATQNHGDSWELTFNGTGIDVISQVNSDLGDVEIALDGAFHSTQSFFSGTRMHQQTVLSISGLAPGVHTITGTMSSGSYMIVDAFTIHPEVADAEAPEVSLTTSQTEPATGWFTGGVSVIAQATDDLDEAPAIEISTGSGWQPYVEPIAIVTEGTTVVRARATDAAGNVSDVAAVTVERDTTAPLTSAKVDTKKRIVALTAKDATSGVSVIEYRIGDGQFQPYTGPITVGKAATTIEYRSIDVAGLTEATRTLELARKGGPK